MAVLCLDTRALEVVADLGADRRAARRMQSMLTSAARLGVPVRVPTAVLAEAYGGTQADAAVDRVLGHGMRPITMGQAMARVAGRLPPRDPPTPGPPVQPFRVAPPWPLVGGITPTRAPPDLFSPPPDPP